MKSKTELVHFSVDGPWFTWFLRHQWIEGGHYQAIRTWNAAFPHLSSPIFIQKEFLEIVSGKKKFEGSSSDKNGFALKDDNTKFWSTVCGGEPNEGYPLLDSWEDVILLKKAQFTLSELNLRWFQLERTTPKTFGATGNNSVRWSEAAQDNEKESSYRKEFNRYWSDLRNISMSLGRDMAFVEEANTPDLNSIRFGGWEGASRRKMGKDTSKDCEKAFEHFSNQFQTVEDYLKKKYSYSMFRWNKEDLEWLFGLHDNDPDPEAMKNNFDIPDPAGNHPFLDINEESEPEEKVIILPPPKKTRKEKIEEISKIRAERLLSKLKHEDAYVKDLLKEAKNDPYTPKDIAESDCTSGIIDKNGNFYGCGFEAHLYHAVKWCEMLGIKPRKEDGLGSDDWRMNDALSFAPIVKVSTDRFFWYSEQFLTPEQKNAIQRYMKRRMLTKATFSMTNDLSFKDGIHELERSARWRNAG